MIRKVTIWTMNVRGEKVLKVSETEEIVLRQSTSWTDTASNCSLLDAKYGIEVIESTGYPR